MNALASAVQSRGDVAGCVVHSDRGSQFRSRKVLRELDRHDLLGSMGQVASAGDNAAMESFFSLLQKNVLNRRRWRHETTFAWRSSPGSNGPTTAAAGKPDSAD